jgi:hypothetical protein
MCGRNSLFIINAVVLECEREQRLQRKNHIIYNIYVGTFRRKLKIQIYESIQK